MGVIKNTFGYSLESPLLFTQLYFWVFFTILLAVYSILYKEKTLRNTYLFLMSLFFYYKSGGYYFFLLVFSTIVDFFIGRGIYKASSKNTRKWLVALSVIVNLGVLSYFKYAYFFIGIINDIFNTKLEVVNVVALLANNLTNTNFDVSSIILPVGISFFTFQTISYSIDIYRGKIKPVNNIIDFGFYVSFFPQLVAGPIVRAAHFVPQLYQKFRLTVRERSHALYMILNGLIKKMLIADYIAINFVDRVFDDPLAYSGLENIFAVYGYSLQIYCDFSGYTDIAIGVALLLGFKLPVNFNSPYKAINLEDFWRRWHISLSSWLRDYLYIPLGGNKKGNLRAYINIMITMLLGGLWHGASLNFMMWGGIHGLGLVFGKLFRRITKLSVRHNRLPRFVSLLFTFHFVTLAWIPFRANTTEKSVMIFKQIFNETNLSILPSFIASYTYVFLLIVAGFLLHWLPAQTKEVIRGYFIQMNIVIKIIVIIIVVLILYQAISAELQPFIYFRF